MKVSEWLATLDSHTIYDARGIAKRFKKETGQEPCWSTHSASEMVGMIRTRGLGGSLKGKAPCVSGYEIAEALADKLASGVERPFKFGRGSRFWDALKALSEAGA